MNQNLKDQFAGALNATGIDLAASADAIATFAAERAAHLATIANEPGIAEAVEAEAYRVWLFAARREVRVADAADQRAAGMIRGLLLGLAS
jgi:phosphosulfolactate phosphohydrolase-like enzyme